MKGQACARVKQRGNANDDNPITNRERWGFRKSRSKTKLPHVDFGRRDRPLLRNDGAPNSLAASKSRRDDGCYVNVDDPTNPYF